MKATTSFNINDPQETNLTLILTVLFTAVKTIRNDLDAY